MTNLKDLSPLLRELKALQTLAFEKLAKCAGSVRWRALCGVAFDHPRFPLRYHCQIRWAFQFRQDSKSFAKRLMHWRFVLDLNVGSSNFVRASRPIISKWHLFLAKFSAKSGLYLWYFDGSGLPLLSVNSFSSLHRRASAATNCSVFGFEFTLDCWMRFPRQYFSTTFHFFWICLSSDSNCFHDYFRLGTYLPAPCFYLSTCLPSVDCQEIREFSKGLDIGSRSTLHPRFVARLCKSHLFGLNSSPNLWFSLKLHYPLIETPINESSLAFPCSASD